MTDYYVRSTDGNDSDNGLTWATAKATLYEAANTAAIGDTIYVSNAHSETTTWTAYGQVGKIISPPYKSRIICVDDTSGEPPTTLANTATVNFVLDIAIPEEYGDVTGLNWDGLYDANLDAFLGETGYVHGINFTSDSIGDTGVLSNGVYIGAAFFNDCTFYSKKTTTDECTIWMTAYNSATKCGFKTDVDAPIDLDNITLVKDCYLMSGSLESLANTDYVVAAPSFLHGFDFSARSNTTYPLLDSADLKNLITPTGFTGEISRYPGGWWFNYHQVNTVTSHIYEDEAGKRYTDTSVYRDDGATDGTTRFSHRYVSDIFDTTIHSPFVALGAPIAIWNDVVDIPVTVRMEVYANSQGSGTNGAFQNDELWLGVDYLRTSNTVLIGHASSCRHPLASVADVPSSTKTWTGGAAGWDAQKLIVTFTPKQAGFLYCYLHLAKSNTVVYACPKLEVTS